MHDVPPDHVNGLPPEDTCFNLLVELALDMRWSWNHAADEIWRQLNPDLWKLTHNPWVVVQSAPAGRIRRIANEPEFREKVDALVQAKRFATDTPAWFQRTHPQAALGSVAYFSMEFMLSEALPIYSGGLGNVAGDQLKAASDLGVPVIGVGLLYSQGYFRQIIDRDGAQQAFYPYNDPGQLPIAPVRAANGERLRLKIELPGYRILVRAWRVQVGRVSLYLLDSNDAANFPSLRGVTSELYGGGPELRLQQEIVLGIGGWRLLEALGIKPDVCHLNEGHAAFAALDRARAFIDATGESFDTALGITRAGNLFTTHTAVAAGFDRFDPALVAQYLGGYAEQKLGITQRALLAPGCQKPGNAAEPFNMACLALRGSGAANAVSRLHGVVSRKLFAPLFPRWPLDEVPIGHVTNGVHMPSWDSAAADALWTKACGKERWLGDMQAIEPDIRRVSDADLWNFRRRTRGMLVDYARDRVATLLTASGGSSDADTVEEVRHLLNPDALTLGFARRFATYKRPNLLLHDPARLVRLLTNPERPVQLILAGKAHPADRAGQDLIRQWTSFISHSAARRHVIFLADYDMLLTEQLVQGVDVWINTPRRPWEACGTSGMKVLVNGGINLSELDGWWAEAWSPELGWALGDGKEHGDDPAWDAVDADALYTLLEREVVPEFYTRDARGIPLAWVRRMRESMAQLTPRFSTNRTVREYTERYYLPLAASYLKRTVGNRAAGKHSVGQSKRLQQQWPGLRFGDLKIETRAAQYQFDIQVVPGDVEPDAIHIELYADPLEDGAAEVHGMKRLPQLDSAAGGCVYRAVIPAVRAASDYTARAVPAYGVAVPLEDAHILWGSKGAE